VFVEDLGKLMFAQQIWKIVYLFTVEIENNNCENSTKCVYLIPSEPEIFFIVNQMLDLIEEKR
jgi:hypothetical protein